MPGLGVPISDEEAAARWRPWTPAELRGRLDGVDAIWGVAAGWAIDLFLGHVTRDHGDIEMSLPSTQFPAIAAALGDFAWDVPGDGRLWPYPEALDRHHQTWLRDRTSGAFLLDVFREPHDGDVWICRRDPCIRMPLRAVYEHNADGIPFVIPEVVLLFKAKRTRPKDAADFDRVVPALSDERRARLRGWLARAHPEHPWRRRLDPCDHPHPRFGTVN